LPENYNRKAKNRGIGKNSKITKTLVKFYETVFPIFLLIDSIVLIGSEAHFDPPQCRGLHSKTNCDNISFDIRSKRSTHGIDGKY
jgi:hypothetical protein